MARKSPKKSASSSKGKKERSETAAASDDTMEALRDYIRARGSDFLKDPNITSIGIGRKNGDGEISLQFTVGKKVPDMVGIESLGSAPIPETISVGDKTFPTDVIERSYEPSYRLVEAETLGGRRQRVDPIRPGISVSHVKGTAGTIGLIVYDRQTGAPCILSNWHVLHGNGGAVEDAIVQPGPFDDNNTAGNFCGNLLRSHLGPAGDCALARIRSREFEREIFELNRRAKRMARVELDDRLVKSGRTTGVTRGVVRRVDVLSKLDYGHPTGKVAIGGFEIGVDPDYPPRDGEISLGGDSGAAWMIADGEKASDIFAGLHYGGESSASTDEHALACYPLSVQKKLDFLLEPPAGSRLPDDELELLVPRTGYDPNFLGANVPTPVLTLSQKRDAVNFGRAQTIPYTHFSVCLSARRRMARFAAWNIDGSRKVVLDDSEFRVDPRIDAKHQHGNELYVNNALDRGHIARRADLCWGPVAEAEQANRDSFFFTNIAPQHARFNQSSRKGLWGELENLVLEQAHARNLRVSVMGGPVFGDDDPAYRGARLPQRFWKLVAYLTAEEELRVACFLLSQNDLLADIESLDLDPFRIHQITVAELSTRTGLNFAALDDADVIEQAAAVETIADTGVVGREIRARGDMVL